uniref:Uncharacterized protein n=1 Tax=Arundo donax TaxID=35708 RepID=A0A0A9ATR3_ARUDO
MLRSARNSTKNQALVVAVSGSGS